MRNDESEERVSLDISEAFEEADEDKNGTISQIELKNFMKSKYQRLSSTFISDLHQTADENHDGELNRHEFENMATDPFFRACLSRYIKFVVPPGARRYADLYRLWPPPICLVLISVLEILLFTIDAVKGNLFGSGPIATALLYDPDKRLQVWRFVTYMFVHVGYAHLVMNLLVQILLGVALEMANGWWRVLLVYLAGVLAGSLGTSILEPTIRLAGASGGVYSLITAHVATIIMNWTEMEFPLSQTMVFVAFIGADIIHIIFVNDPIIGYITHFCGAAAGLLVGVMILRNIRVNRTEKILQVVALVIYIGFMSSTIIWNIASVTSSTKYNHNPMQIFP